MKFRYAMYIDHTSIFDIHSNIDNIIEFINILVATYLYRINFFTLGKFHFILVHDFYAIGVLCVSTASFQNLQRYLKDIVI